jgi:hypothetical protein
MAKNFNFNGKLDKHWRNHIIKQFENPNESYVEVTEKILSILIDMEVSILNHRKAKANKKITDDDFKDMYLIKSMLYNIMAILGWNETLYGEI